jgi:hypothetical protein
MRLLKLILVISLALFGVFWFALVLPSFVETETWSLMNPLQQYILYNIGFFFIITVFFGGLVSFSLTHRLNLIQMLMNGLAGFLFFSFVLDIYQPPFVVGSDGSLLVDMTSGTVAGASVDYMLYFVYTSMGMSGSAVYYMVYIITPAIMVVGTAILLGLNKFVRFIAEAM